MRVRITPEAISKQNELVSLLNDVYVIAKLATKMVEHDVILINFIIKMIKMIDR